MAHITGGGFLENIPRVLPQGLGIEIKKGSWTIPPVFNIMQQIGHLSNEDLFRTFNMGIGLVIILNENEVPRLYDHMASFKTFDIQAIGRVISSETQEVRIS